MVDFERGGAPVLTHKERKKLFEQASQDVQSSLSSPPPAGKQVSAHADRKKEVHRKKRRDRAQVDFDDGSQVVEKVEKTLPFVDMLSFKRLTVGMTLLGVVRSVHSGDVAVALPNHLVGYLKIEDLTDSLAKELEAAVDEDDTPMVDAPVSPLIARWRSWLRPAQVLPVRIKALERAEGQNSSIRIELTTRVSQVEATGSPPTAGSLVAAEVLSREDKGLLVRLSPTHTAFLSFSHASLDEEDYQPGMLLSVVVTGTKGRVLQVSDSLKTPIASAASPSSSASLSYDTIFAGMLVTASRVKSVPGRGSVYVLEGGVYATSDLFHDVSSKDQDTGLVARVLYADRDARRVALTFLPHLAHFGLAPHGPLPASTKMEAKVVRVDATYGLLLTQVDASSTPSSASPRTNLYAHITRVSDETPTSLDAASYMDKTFAIRVVDYDPCDDLVHVSLQASVLQASLLCVGDAKPGQSLKGTVMRLETYGALVQLAPGVRALCPAIHWNEDTSGHCPLRPGQKARFRVLMVDAPSGRLILTAKPSLLASPYDTIDSYESAQAFVGFTHGYVKGLTPAGAVIGFYQDVRGFLPMREQLGGGPLRLGQVLRVRVLNVEASTDRMTLSMRQGGSEVASSRSENASTGIDSAVSGDVLASLPPLGSLVSVRVRRVVETGLEVNVLNEGRPTGVQGRVAAVDLPLGDSDLGCLFSDRYPVGTVLTARVAEYAVAKGHNYLPVSHRLSGNKKQRLFVLCTEASAPERSLETVTSGTAASQIGVVTRILPRGTGLLVQLTRHHLGRVHPCDVEVSVIADKTPATPEQVATELAWLKRPLEAFRSGAVLSVRINGHDTADASALDQASHNPNLIDLIATLPLHAETLEAASQDPKLSPLVAFKSALVLEPGQPCVGVVTNITPQGVFVALSRSQTALVKASFALASFSKDWMKQVPATGTRVVLHIVAFDAETSRIQASLIGPPLTKEEKRARKRQAMEDDKVAAAEETLPAKRNRVRELLSQVEPVEIEAAVSIPRQPAPAAAAGLPASARLLQALQTDASVPSVIDAAVNEDSSDVEFHDAVSELASDHSDSMSDDDAPATRPTKSSRREEEAKISAVETAMADGHLVPSSPADFERLVLAEPGSSLPFIQWMAWHASRGEVSEARRIAERALAALPYRADQEKHNIWLAWLNLEWSLVTGVVKAKGSKPGALSSDEPLDQLLAEATVRADAKRILLAAWDLVEGTLKARPGSTLRERCVKRLRSLEHALMHKFKASCKVWIKVWLAHAHPDVLRDRTKAGTLAAKAAQSLPKHKRDKFTLKLAHLEYVTLHERERGRTMLETLLACHPKRFDWWQLYVAAEIKAQAPAPQVRALIERVLALPFSAKKIKAMFKLYLGYERDHGDAKTLERVKALAKAYVERVTAGSGSPELSEDDEHESDEPADE